MKITLQGMDDVRKQMRRIERGTRALSNYQAEVGSKLPYAYGAEYGTHRKSARTARKSGGARYLARAIETVLAGADRDLSEGLRKVTAPGIWLLRRQALWVRRLARAYAPRGPRKKRRYRLHKSIIYKVRKGG